MLDETRPEPDPEQPAGKDAEPSCNECGAVLGVIDSAILELYQPDPAPAAAVATASQVCQPWTEYGMTWNIRPFLCINSGVNATISAEAGVTWPSRLA